MTNDFTHSVLGGIFYLNLVPGVSYLPLTYSGNAVEAPYYLSAFDSAPTVSFVRRSRSSDEYRRSTVPSPQFKRKVGYDGDYFFLNVPKLIELGVAPEDIARIAYLASHATHKKLEIFDENRTMTLRRLQEDMLRISDREFRRLYSLMRQHNILLINPAGKFAFSSRFVMRGAVPDEFDVFKVYRFPYRALYEQTDTTRHKYIGYVLSILHLMNPHWNAFCGREHRGQLVYDLETRSPADLVPLSLADVCTIIGVDPTNSTRFFNKLLSLKFHYAGMERSLVSIVQYREPSVRKFVCVNSVVTHAGVNWSAAESFGGFFPRASFTPPDRVDTFEDVLREIGCV